MRAERLSIYYSSGQGRVPGRKSAVPGPKPKLISGNGRLLLSGWRASPSYALIFEANGIMLRLGMGKERPAVPGTVLGWQVPDASAAVTELEQAGVRFERYEFLKQEAQGIWAALPPQESRGSRIPTETY